MRETIYDEGGAVFADAESHGHGIPDMVKVTVCAPTAVTDTVEGLQTLDRDLQVLAEEIKELRSVIEQRWWQARQRREREVNGS